VDAPVCGSDGVTYRNRCSLQKAACSDRGLGVVCAGFCPAASRRGLLAEDGAHEAACSGWKCPADFAPVCADDGVTYSKLCSLRRVNCKLGASAKLLHTGRCFADPTTRRCSNVCELSYK